MISRRYYALLFASAFVLLTSFIWQKKLKQSFIYAFLTGVGTTGALMLVERNCPKLNVTMQDSLQQNIQQLKYERQQLQRYFKEALIIEAETAASIRALKFERLQLLNRIACLHTQRNHVLQAVNELKQSNAEQQAHFLQVQSKIKKLRYQEQRLLTRLTDRTAAKEGSSSGFDGINHQIQAKYRYKLELEGLIYDLRTESKVLEQRNQELQENLRISHEQYQEVSCSLLAGKAVVNRLLGEIQARRQEKARLIEELETLSLLHSSHEYPEPLSLPSTWQI